MSSRRSRRSWSELALWIADEYCSTPARALALVLPPGVGRGVTPRVRVRTVLVAEIADEGRAALADGVRLTEQAAWRPRASRRRGPARRRRRWRRPRLAAAARRSRPACPGTARAAPASAGAGRRRARGGVPELTEEQRARWSRCSRQRRRATRCAVRAARPRTARSAAATPPPAASCCTASPARARPRSTCARRGPRSTPGAA